MRDKVFGGLDLTVEEQMAYALLLSQEEEEARLRSTSAKATIAGSDALAPSSSSIQPPHADDDMDETLREALELSMLDQPAGDDDGDGQFEMLFDDDDDDNADQRPSSSASVQALYQSSTPSRSTRIAYEDRSTSCRSSTAPTPVFGSFDDRTEWPAMLSRSPPPVGKGKQQQAASSPIPFVPSRPPQPSWSAIARSPPNVHSANMSPSLVAQVSPSLRAVGSEARAMTREQREDEELRLVLEMSLNDQ